MLTGEIRSKIDQVWNAFWAGGIANPLEVIEQITYLLFMRGLDEIQTREESKASIFERPVERVIFPDAVYRVERDEATGEVKEEITYAMLRWSRFKNDDAQRMFKIVADYVFPFLREMAEDGTSHAEHMKGARFTIPTPGLLAKVVDMLAEIPLEDRDTKGDLYEYMLGKIASAGMNGQFRTPRHIIKLMVELMAPTPKDTICDPASGTCGFLVAAGEYLREHHKGLFRDKALNRHFHHGMFHGYDFDNTMLRIGSMNMQLHGVEGADIRYRDSLSTGHADDADKYSLVLANPPFAGSLDYETTAADLLSIVKTKKTELLFMALFLKLLKPGGRAAVIVPNGVLENDGRAYEQMRRKLINDCRLIAVISLPHWVFKPYASVATSILIFKKADVTDEVLFFKVESDGYSSGADKKQVPESDLPRAISAFKNFEAGEHQEIARKSHAVSRKKIIDSGYDLSPEFHLSGYEYPSGIPLQSIANMFHVVSGNIPASTVNEGNFNFYTSGSEVKKSIAAPFAGPAIVIPTVSSTGHGHASIKNIHLAQGRFSAATITAVLLPKEGFESKVNYVYYYLLSHKDELLVTQMRGAANVTLSLERLGRVRVPIFKDETEQNSATEKLIADDRRIAELHQELNLLKLRREESLERLRRRI